LALLAGAMRVLGVEELGMVRELARSVRARITPGR